jgi:hypothetical protein
MPFQLVFQGLDYACCLLSLAYFLGKFHFTYFFSVGFFSLYIQCLQSFEAFCYAVPYRMLARLLSTPASFPGSLKPLPKSSMGQK